MLVTAAALATLVSPNPAVVWIGQIGTAAVGSVVGPALAGLTLGLVGERLFSQQIARNEFWNHSGNLAALVAVFAAVSLFGLPGMIWLMIATAAGTLGAVAAIDPSRIDHLAARGLSHDDGEPGPSGLAVLFERRGLLLLALVLLIFHWGNAPMSRLIAQQFSIELGTPFRTTAIITGVSQLCMIFVAALAPWLIRRLGLTSVMLIGLVALPLRGLLAGAVAGFWVVYPVQALDGIGAGLLGIVTPIAVERLLSGTGRFNVGLAAVMTIQGVGASLSNVLAGYLVTRGGYGLSHVFSGAIAVVAVILFVLWHRAIVRPMPSEAARSQPAA